MFKKTTAVLSALLTGISPTPKEYCKATVGEIETVKMEQQTPDIVVRVGEYDGKPGKRVYINPNAINIPDDIPIHADENGFYIQEYDINLKLSKAIYKKLEAMGIDVNLQIASGKGEDLNAAGRIAVSTGTKAYLSIHHNYCENESAKGYEFFTNRGNVNDRAIADKLSNRLSAGKVSQRSNKTNDGYIGELNATGGLMNILYEGGFFSNLEELQVIMSNEHIEFVSTQIAEELATVLK